MPRAVLTARRDAGGGLTLVTLAVPPDVAAAYVAPGQYVEARAGEASGYFVLAGDLGQPAWELLVRDAPGAAAALVRLAIGDALEASAPLGAGYPLERARGRELVVAVAGSALAVARPILRARLAASGSPRTHLYIGVRAARDLPLAFEVEAWAEARAHVVLCVSGAELEHDPAVVPAAERAVGYVQAAIEAAVSRGDLPRGVLVFAAGAPAMLEDMRDLAARGVAEVVTNV